MPAPHEIVAFPLTVYLAPTDTAMPAIADPDSSFDPAWLKLGTEGNKNYEDAGVSVTHNETIETFTGAGGTVPRKAFRTAEGLVLGLTLVDLSPEQYAAVLDNAEITTVAPGSGVAGEKSIDLYRGIDVTQYALLARGQSSVDNTLLMQYEWPTVFQSAEPAPSFAKGTPAGLACEFTAMEVVAGVFGTVRIQTDAAT